MIEYFRKAKSLEANVKVELYLSTFATKEDFKNAGGNTLDFARKIDLTTDSENLMQAN